MSTKGSSSHVSYWLKFQMDNDISIFYRAAKKHFYLAADAFVKQMERQYGAQVLVYAAYPSEDNSLTYTACVISHL
jgi:hypothetical protein